MLSLKTNYIGALPLLETAWKRAVRSLSLPMDYPDTKGYMPLREKIAGLYNTTSDSVFITGSATEAIHLIAQVEQWTRRIPPA